MMESFTKFVLLAFVAFVVWGNSQATTVNSTTTGSPASTAVTTKTPDSSTVPSSTKDMNSTTPDSTTANQTTAANATLTTPHGGTPSLIQTWGQLVALVPALVLLSV